MFDRIFDFLDNLIQPITKLLDDSNTSAEEKAELKKAVFEIQTRTQLKLAEMELKSAEINANLQKEMNKNGSFLTRNWRPFLMICFGLIVVGKVMGWIEADIPSWIGETVKYSLGIYIGGRSIEKTGIIDKLFDKASKSP